MNSFFLHLLYIGLFLFSNEGRGVSFVTDGIVDIENTSWKVLAYGIYARVVDVSEILLVRCAHSFNF